MIIKSSGCIFDDIQLCKKIVLIDGEFISHLLKNLSESNNSGVTQAPEILNELLIIALSNKSTTLEYIPAVHQTPELCELAVKKYGYAIRYVDESLQTFDLCKIALDQNAFLLQFIKNQTDEVCRYALQINPKSYMYIKNKTEEYTRFVAEKDRGMKFSAPDTFKYLFV